MTTVRFNSKEWVPTTRDEPDEEFPEGREHLADYWDTQISISGETRSYAGPQQISGPGITAESTNEELVAALKVIYGGAEDDEWIETNARED